MKCPLARLAGTLLRGFRAGDQHLAINHPAVQGLPQTIKLHSSWFEEGAIIPSKAAGRGVGHNISPPLEWSGVPTNIAGYLLILQDPDAPLLRPFVHLISLGIPPEHRSVEPGELSENGEGAPYGQNTSGAFGYQGPRALPAHGPHRYVFQLIALSKPPISGELKKLRNVLEANAKHAIAYGTLTGIFEQV